MANFTKIITKTIKELLIISPIFYLAIILGLLIEIYMPESMLGALLEGNTWLAIPIATLVGIILPIPRYATYPIAFALFVSGVGYGVVFSLIGGEVVGESVARDILEIKYLGFKFFASRAFLSFFFISFAGIIIEIIL